MEKGTYFRFKRTSPTKDHFNLYSGCGILFTKDHIIPRSLGGADRQSNYQVMCEKCNNLKGNYITIRDLLTGTTKHKGTICNKIK